MDAGYQERVAGHVALVTEGDPTDLAERRDRFGEESLEFQQALGQTRAEAHAQVDYVHGRPAGDPGSELGGTLYTLAALANEVELDMATCAEAELARLFTPEIFAKIRRKRAARHGRGPLPGLDLPSGYVPDRRSAFADGAAARALGGEQASCPYSETVDDGLREAWESGWNACHAAGGA